MAVPMGDGPPSARVMIVGEAWGEDEERAGKPFVGRSGQELDRMLHDAGILRSECYLTNLVNARPPRNDLAAWIPVKKSDLTADMVKVRDRFVRPIVAEGYASLRREIELVKPSLLIAMGNSALWALTGAQGITKWRGSLMNLDGHSSGTRVIPTYHPAAVLRMWEWRYVAVNDLRRALRELTAPTPRPQWKFTLRPSFPQVMKALRDLEVRAEVCCDTPVWLDLDLETRAGHIACCGLSWSRTEALCIPFMCVEDREGYWMAEEESAIVFALYRLLTHPNVRVRWQNGLYDAQYIHRHWHFAPANGQDTMVSQHTLWAALPKSLAFQASMYAGWYYYWKDEGKTWDLAMSEDQLWAYNCQDCIYTREVGEVESAVIERMGMREVEQFQQSMFEPVLRAMLQGVRVIPAAKRQLKHDIEEELGNRQKFLTLVLGHEVNPASPKQMQALFYDDLAQQPVLKKTKGPDGFKWRPSCDDEALNTIGEREPLLRPLCNAISDIRTLKKLSGDFVDMELDADGRMRCSFNIAGDAEAKSAPYSYRLSSSKSAFGSGGNLQTIPSEKSKSAGKAKARGSMEFQFPNVRSMFGPDPGYTFFDMDLDRADLQVVVWEAEDAMLKAALRMGADVHLLNVYALDGKEAPPLEELVESHPAYGDHRGPRKHKREFSKVFCHATNYLGKARTVAAHTGRTVHEIERAQRQWFGAHPGIKQWHERVIHEVTTRRYVENKFGYRWYVFDRIDEQLFPKAVAWVPQSTVGGVINRVWRRLYDEAHYVQVLLQVHDSLAGQFPTERREEALADLARCGRIVVPYDEPLVIPCGVKTSTESWGACV